LTLRKLLVAVDRMCVAEDEGAMMAARIIRDEAHTYSVHFFG